MRNILKSVLIQLNNIEQHKLAHDAYIISILINYESKVLNLSEITTLYNQNKLNFEQLNIIDKYIKADSNISKMKILESYTGVPILPTEFIKK